MAIARLYADENFKRAAVEELRRLGHDVLTVQEAGQQGGDDPHVLAYAAASGRAVLTFNRRHFIRLHLQSSAHAGIIVCTDDDATAHRGSDRSSDSSRPQSRGTIDSDHPATISGNAALLWWPHFGRRFARTALSLK